MLTDRRRREAASLLRSAEVGVAPIGPLVESFPGIGTEDAYEIQLVNIRQRLAEGARVTGCRRRTPPPPTTGEPTARCGGASIIRRRANRPASSGGPG